VKWQLGLAFLLDVTKQWHEFTLEEAMKA